MRTTLNCSFSIFLMSFPSFLESLSKESRLIFLRRYLYVDTVAEIAARYGISESKVKTQLHRTRAKLHTHLAKEGIYV